MRFVRVLAQRGASMPLVIINQRDVKAVITFHMVRKLQRHMEDHSLTWCLTLPRPVGKDRWKRFEAKKEQFGK